LKWVTSVQALSSGNLLVGNWLGAGGGEVRTLSKSHATSRSYGGSKATW
jgi:hypothetical protein